MNDIALRAEGLSKQYCIGRRERYRTLRDTVTDAVCAPFHRLSRLINPQSTLQGVESNNMIWALKDVSFEVNHGEVVGIIGRNGAGKSTLLKILSRITEPTEGCAEIHGRIGSLLEVGTGFHPELTGRENIYLNGAILGMKKAEIERKFDEIVSFAEVETFIDTPVKHYSSGMYVRLAFAVAAHLEPEILLVDEVLAVGDAAFQKRCLGKMSDVAKEGRTVLFVSHNMAAIESLCDKAIFLNRGSIATAGTLLEAINLYLGHIMTNEVIFDNKPIKKALVRQSGDEIELIVEYKVDHELDIPCLGFVISDYLGNPICGSNPIVESLEHEIGPRSSGKIKVVVQYPKLLNGTYRVSLWFGNGKEEYFNERDCLVFDVVNMASLRQLPASSVGPVFPKCKWIFD